MIELDFNVRRSSDSANIDWTWANEMLLRYDSFLWDIRFVVGDLDLSMDWGWIPVLDFALSLRHIGQRLYQGDSAVFDFTDSDLTITSSVREMKVVQIEASYVDGVGVTDVDEFCESARGFLSRVRRHIEKEVPEIQTNPRYLNLLKGEFT